MDVEYLTIGLFGYVFSLLQIIILAFLGDEETDKMLSFFPNDSPVFAILLPLKVIGEIFIIFFVASYTDVTQDQISHDIAAPALRWSALWILLLGLNMWPLTTYYWMKMKVATWGVWGTLVLLFVGSIMLTISVLFQVLIPACMNGDDTSLVVLSIVVLILSFCNILWYAVVDMWLWAGSFLIKANQTGHYQLNVTLSSSAIDRIAGSKTYIETVPINNEELLQSI